jgi:hypothetical protein
MQVLNHRCLRSICWVFRFPTSCTCVGKCRSLVPQPSVQSCLIPKVQVALPVGERLHLAYLPLFTFCRFAVFNHLWTVALRTNDREPKQPYCVPNNSLDSTTRLSTHHVEKTDLSHYSAQKFNIELLKVNVEPLNLKCPCTIANNEVQALVHRSERVAIELSQVTIGRDKA